MLQLLFGCCAVPKDAVVDELPSDPVAKIKELETKAALLHKTAQQQNKQGAYDGEQCRHPARDRAHAGGVPAFAPCQRRFGL